MKLFRFRAVNSLHHSMVSWSRKCE